jgi:TusA-related sulfurtransferase
MIQLDLRGTPCPINFVRTKMKLEQMNVGDLLEVWLDAGEPIEQVPDSLRMAGYTVEKIIVGVGVGEASPQGEASLEDNRQEYFRLQVRR